MLLTIRCCQKGEEVSVLMDVISNWIRDIFSFSSFFFFFKGRWSRDPGGLGADILNDVG